MDPTQIMQVTWQGLASILGLSAFLAAVIIPIGKAYGLASSRSILTLGLLSGQLFAQLAFLLKEHGASAQSLSDAFLVGLIAAGLATGLYEGKKALLKQ